MTDDIKKRDQINTRILQTAHKLLIENDGIQNVKMYQIARKTGIGQATLYRRYKSMDEIFIDLLIKDFELLKAKITLLIEDSNNSTYDQIKLFFECLIEFHETGYQYFKSYVMTKPSNHNYYSSPIYLWLSQTLYNLLENHLNKQSPINLEIKFITHTLLTVIGIEAYVFLRHNNYTKEQIKNNLYTIYLEPICNAAIKSME